MKLSKPAVATVGVATMVVLIGVVGALVYVRSSDTLTLDSFSTQSLEPWPDGVGVIDSWPGTEGPGGGDIEPEAESLYLLIAGESADLRGEPLLVVVTDHVRLQGWDIRNKSGNHWATVWGTDESPPSSFYLGLLDGYLASGPGRGVERSNDDLAASHGPDSGLVVMQVIASE